MGCEVVPQLEMHFDNCGAHDIRVSGVIAEEMHFEDMGAMEIGW